MSILQRIRDAFSVRSSSRYSGSFSAEDEHYWKSFIDTYWKSSSSTGIEVTPESAMYLSVVFACIRVISESVASLPLFVYSVDEEGSKEKAKDHPLYRILHYKPNNYQTPFEFRETLTGHCNMRGNAYCFVERNGMNEIIALHPLNPAWMQVEPKGTSLVYRYGDPSGKKKIYTQEKIWHIKFFTQDGIVGVSPIEYARESIGLGLAAESYGSESFTRKPVFSGIFKTPKRLQPDQKSKLKESLDEFASSKRFRSLILEDQLEWVNVGLSNTDQQYIQTRQFQIEEIARIFRVPCVLIGYPDKSATYASVEQMMLSFVTHTLRPWLIRIEQSAQCQLLDEDEMLDYSIEHKVDALLRGDTKTRYESYQIAIGSRFLTVNEVRGLENLNPVEGGDEMSNPAVTPGPLNEQNQEGENGEDDDAEQDGEADRSA